MDCPGYVLIGAAVLAPMVCLATAATGFGGWTIAAGAVAILAAALGLVWVYAERRRVARMERR